MAKLTLWLHHIAKLYDKAMSVRSLMKVITLMVILDQNARLEGAPLKAELN